MRFYLKTLSAAVVAAVTVSSLMCEPSSVHGQQSYELPPQEVVDIIDAKPEPSISFSPDRKWMLMLERPEKSSRGKTGALYAEFSPYRTEAGRTSLNPPF